MHLSWSPLEGSMATAVSRNSAINTMWRLTPEEHRTPVRRRMVIALVDYHERTGRLAPEPEPDAKEGT